MDYHRGRKLKIAYCYKMIKSEILEKICIAITANNIKEIAKLVEKAFDAGYTVKEIKDSVRTLMERNFDAICEFYRAMHFEENRRTKRGK